ncbi:hypothetical protein, partial [Gardnerella greenwoodii]|uniref:hypothetical protein n=1 Tax=Gardnerella greenwoodii TaxID=2914925 RepID=UPI001C3FE6CA
CQGIHRTPIATNKTRTNQKQQVQKLEKSINKDTHVHYTVHKTTNPQTTNPQKESQQKRARTNRIDPAPDSVSKNPQMCGPI